MTTTTKVETHAPMTEMSEMGVPEMEVETEAPMHVDATGMTKFEEEVAKGDLRIYQEEVEAKRVEEGRRYYLAHRALDPNGTWMF